MWDHVRVSGGAYGGFCDFDTHSGTIITCHLYGHLVCFYRLHSKVEIPCSGVFSFLSYRDPNLLKTLNIYDGTSQFLRELDMDDDALTRAIIGTIGDVDSYQLPDAKGYTR